MNNEYFRLTGQNMPSGPTGGDWDFPFCAHLYGPFQCNWYKRCVRVSAGDYVSKSIYLELLPYIVGDPVNTTNRVRVTIAYSDGNSDVAGAVFEHDYGNNHTIPCTTLGLDVAWKSNIGTAIDFTGATFHVEALTDPCDDDAGGSTTGKNCPGYWCSNCAGATPNKRIVTLPAIAGWMAAQAVTVTQESNIGTCLYIGWAADGQEVDLYMEGTDMRVRVNDGPNQIQWQLTEDVTDCLLERTLPWSSDDSGIYSGVGTTVDVSGWPIAP